MDQYKKEYIQTLLYRLGDSLNNDEDTGAPPSKSDLLNQVNELYLEIDRWDGK